jgi:hypothetical protein
LDIWYSQRKVKGQELSTSEEIIEAVMAIWSDVPFEELQSLFCERTQRVTWVIGHMVEDYLVSPSIRETVNN